MKNYSKLMQVGTLVAICLLSIPTSFARTAYKHAHHSRAQQSAANRAGRYASAVSHRAHQRHGTYAPVSYVHSYYGGNGGGASDYLSQMGGESRWPEGKRIRVYVAPGRSSFSGIIANCMNQWASASGHRFSWSMTGDPYSADYTIGWTSRQTEVSSGTEAGLTTTDTSVDPETGMEFIEHAKTHILTRYEGKTLSDGELEKTALHEVGHALGLEGHSSNPTDIMYYAVSSRQSGTLTGRDKNTMARLYSN